jgi:FkbM family methyltransferase
MIFKKNKSIFTDFVAKNNLTFNYIDIGARGDIVSPWLELENTSLIVGFEPDSKESKRLNNAFKKRRYFDIALWSQPATNKVYINEWESTSSMYLPNVEFINKFQVQHWEGRKAKFELEVECNTLDNVLLEHDVIPDFIKIDTQGAELEILRGAENILKEYSPIVTCETWCAEVYKGAPMMHEIIDYMDCLGYQVFDMEIAAAWRHGKETISSKPKSIGYEVLFVKVKEISSKNRDQMLKFLLLLELYGYRDYAIYLMSLFNEDFDHLNLLMRKNNNKEQRIYNKVLNIAVNQINKIFNFKLKVYPAIKY